MSGKKAICAALTAACAVGCASSYPPPTQRMAETLAVVRGAEEVGADSNPQGQLHLRLAQEELQNAKLLADNGDNRRADFVLVRAKADADLALAEAREAKAFAEAQNAIKEADAMKSAVTNAQPPSVMPSPALAPTTPSATHAPSATHGGSR